MRIFLMCLLAVLSLGACKDDSRKESKASPCDGRRWANTTEEINCRFPAPPIGRWHAVYTEKFAKKHNLPLENVSTDLSPSVDYMEMDVQPYGNGGTACLVNMLIKKPNDVALYYAGDAYIPWLPDDRTLLHLIDINKSKDQQRGMSTFNTVSRNLSQITKGYRVTVFSLVIENALPGYDYITANAGCRNISMYPQFFPDKHAFWVNKASIWGKYETPYRSSKNPRRPKGQDFYNSHFFINIPKELIFNIFEDVPVGGQ